MKGVGSEQVGLSGCFALNGFGKLLEETIKVVVVEMSIMFD